MALRRRSAVARVVSVLLVAAGLWAVNLSAQESGALPSAERSAWSRLLGSRQYEYDERVDLSLDGSAVVDVNASLAALAALRGGDFNLDPEARFDRQAVRAFFEGSGATIREITAFRKHGRRFVHARLDVADIQKLSGIAPLAWSRYQLSRGDKAYHFV